MAPSPFPLSRLLLWMFLLVTIAACAPDRGSELPEVVDFDAHIQPILSTACYVCHGPDVSTREAGLRLDLRDSATVVLESGFAAIVPGDPGASELIKRLHSEDPEARMPPAEANKVLTPHEIALIERWIAQGATYRPHWALVPPETPTPPAVRRLIAPANPIDRFLEARLRDEGIPPAGEAAPETLVRRLSYVLTGLPPSPEGLAAFLEDPSDQEYEHLVDRLLASPHFGERWARHWMDVVRYADTRGHEFDYPVVGAWTYRDYLIRAFNQDVPYDRLILEHLAGDLLDTPRPHPESGFDESPIGTVFYTLGEGTHSPVDLQIDESNRIDNIIDVAGKTFLGLTVACARCHDHKFDPIPTTDYYSLYGIVKSSRFALRDAHLTPRDSTTARELRRAMDDLRQSLGQAWRADLASRQTLPALAVDLPMTPDTSRVKILGDFREEAGFGDWRADGLAFGDGAGSFLTGDALAFPGPRRVSSAALSHRLYGTLRSPTFTVDADHITVRAAGRHARVRLIIDNFQLIQYPIYGGLEQAIDDPSMREYTFDIARWKGRPAYLELFPGYFKQQSPVIEPGAYIEAEYAWMHDGDAPDATRMAMWHGDTLRTALSGAVDRWIRGLETPEDAALLIAASDAGWLAAPESAYEAERDRLLQLESEIEPPVLVAGVIEGDGEDHPVFIRGSTAMPSAEPVERRFLDALPGGETPFVGAGSGRLDFARAVASPANPLTARVMVNRLWHHVFGTGLVETVDNFGLQGTRPEHPALLDYLATRFVEEGWSVKAMLRLMVTSEAFRRGTAATRAGMARDPQNRLWHHYPVRRLEAEAIRDAMLAVSGSLDPTPFGPPVPVHLSAFMTGRGRPADSGPLDGDGRRSIYQSIRRNFLPPLMLVFDMPIPFSTFGSRNTSNVPAQSLTLLNDPFVAQQAERWGRRMAALQELHPSSRLQLMYRAALSRQATGEEVEAGLEFLDVQAAHYEVDVTDWRPWRDFAHTLFNLKEFIHLV